MIHINLLPIKPFTGPSRPCEASAFLLFLFIEGSSFNRCLVWVCEKERRKERKERRGGKSEALTSYRCLDQINAVRETTQMLRMTETIQSQIQI